MEMQALLFQNIVGINGFVKDQMTVWCALSFIQLSLSFGQVTTPPKSYAIEFSGARRLRSKAAQWLFCTAKGVEAL